MTDSRAEFEAWFFSAKHREKYTRDSSPYLAAWEAWQAAKASEAAPADYREGRKRLHKYLDENHGVIPLTDDLSEIERIVLSYAGEASEDGCPLGDDCDLTATYMAGQASSQQTEVDRIIPRPPEGYTPLAFSRPRNEFIYLTHAHQWQLCPAPAPAVPDDGADIEFITDALTDYANALTSGELDGAGRYLPADIVEQAELLSAAQEQPQPADRADIDPPIKDRPWWSVYQPEPVVPNVDDLAQFIRKTDGDHSMGAGKLAEHIVGWLSAAQEQPAEQKRTCRWVYEGAAGFGALWSTECDEVVEDNHHIGYYCPHCGDPISEDE